MKYKSDFMKDEIKTLMSVIHCVSEEAKKAEFRVYKLDKLGRRHYYGKLATTKHPNHVVELINTPPESDKIRSALLELVLTGEGTYVKS